MTRYDKAFAQLLINEGGFSNNINDPGGRTIYGITETYDKEIFAQLLEEYVNNHFDNAKNIAKEYYKEHYWNILYEAILDSSLAFKLFDLGVNIGKNKAVRMLQEVIREFDQTIIADGIFGNKTLQAINHIDKEQLYARYVRKAELYYKNLKTFSIFGRGWLSRLSKRIYLD